MQSDRNSLPPKLLTQHYPLLTLPSFQPVWKEWTGWKGDKQLSFKSLLSGLSWEALWKCILYSWSSGLPQSNSKSPVARQAGGPRKGTWEPLYFLSSSGRSKAPCETAQAVARAQLAAHRTCSTARFRQPLWQCCDKSITSVTSQPQATAERPKSRIYIPPKVWISIVLNILGHPYICVNK